MMKWAVHLCVSLHFTQTRCALLLEAGFKFKALCIFLVLKELLYIPTDAFSSEKQYIA